jgi:uncharacterized protein (DUF4415 family)
MSKTDIVKYELDLARPAALTPAQQDELRELAARSDDPVDTTDIPLLSDGFWQNAVNNPFYRPVKAQLTVRLDADILAWLRASGPGYQTRLNRILREAMVSETVGPRDQTKKSA